MSLTVTSQQIKSENIEISSENDYGENDSKSDINFSYSIEQNDLNIDDDEEVIKVLVQNTATTMSKDLRKSNKVFTCNKQSEYDVENPNLENSPKSSWQHCDGSFIDKDVYAISAAGQTLPNSSLQITSIDGFFNRKRGRPPKNRFVEVYKNTHQKPQAIFTSFKLEKQEKCDATINYENSINYCLQSGVKTVSGCDNDNNTMEYPRHKPNTNSTHRKRLNKVNLTSTMFSTTSGRNKTFDGNSKEQTVNQDDDNLTSPKSYKLTNATSTFNERSKSSTAVVNAGYEDNAILKSIPFDSLSAIKKPKICGTADHVTVVRAAGTFYPENSNENSKVVNNCKKKTSDLSENKEGGIFLGKEELQFPNHSYNDKNVPQNLSLKDTAVSNADCLESPSSSSAASLAASSPILPQIYSVLQMQQQLYAFYHRMALMTPAFSHLDLKNLLIPILTHTAATALSSPSSSSSSVTGAETDLALHNKDLVNMILNLKKHQANKKDVSCELAKATKPKGSVRPPQKRTISSTMTSVTSRGNNSIQNVTSFENNPDAVHNKTPDEKLPEAQFPYGREQTPSGYFRFRFNEDCGYNKCGYRQHQSHFHCKRTDCQYSFCDKTRFAQHTARHERLDSLLGSDFQQYRTTMTCNYSNCPYDFSAMIEDSNDILNGRKSSHYHCLKCRFVCSDTSKILPHRRLHNKMEFIRLAGFRKVTGNENCMLPSALSETKKSEPNINVNSDIGVSESGKPLVVQCDAASNPAFEFEPHCPYAMRQVHYHCLVCNCSVLLQSQLLAHKHRNLSWPNITQQSETTNLLSDNINSNKSK